ncbi:DNA polymerase III subunit delta [Acidisphaera sp. L21]|uniref:DNA polymerase III subunit delta n=1 Tax=Acidisphaera sp. L21 TaxID=1641851 RepID=UPI00131E8A3F|nr:DNA polymerase III subunit delta [Acidisphaera sp. L21]
MKIASHQIAGVLKDPAPYIGILLYGEDTGRVRDHAMSATLAVIGAVSDPFRSAVLTRDEHGRLRDEVTSLSLTGGRRVVRVQDATDGLAAIVEGLSKYRADTLIVLETGALTPRSKLRVMAEKQPQWAAIACYPDTGAAVSSEIKRVLSEAGLSVEPSALAFLTTELAGDSTRRRGELEKLRLYAAQSGTVTLEEAQACCSISLDATLSAAISAALSGRVVLCDTLLEELGRDGATGPGVLAVLASQVQRILKVRLLVDEGRSAEEACRTLQPPIYPRQMPAFLQEVQRWSTARLEGLGRAIREADIACKRAASPDLAIAGRLLGVVARSVGGRGR